MSRKFKLIKKYPGLRDGYEIGDVVEPGNGIATSSFWYYKNGRSPLAPDIADFPECWEEVKKVKKDYEILSFISTGLDVPHIYVRDVEHKDKFVMYYGLRPYFTEEEFLNSNGDFKIKSVLRFSDGQIFTLGDRVHLKKWEDDAWELKSIEIWKNKVILFRSRDKGERWWEDQHMELQNAAKQKPTLLLTDDGVEIFDRNTKLYGLLPKAQWQTETMNSHHWINREERNKSAWKVFSTEKARDEYRELNIPQFSMRETKALINFWSMAEIQSINITETLPKIDLEYYDKIK